MIQTRISLLVVLIFGTVLMGVSCSTSNKNYVFQNPNTTTPVEASSTQTKSIPVQKTFDSSKLGINFTYDEREVSGSGKIKIKEVDNKIYVYLDGYDYLNGQSVEVFSKDPKLTLEETIKNKFLKGYSSKDCWVKILGPNDYPRSGSENSISPNLIFAAIAFPLNTTNTSLPWWENGAKCPVGYSITNAVNYFIMDKNIPGKYLFVKLGQEMIASDGNVVDSTNQLHTWFYSLRLR